MLHVVRNNYCEPLKDCLLAEDLEKKEIKRLALSILNSHLILMMRMLAMLVMLGSTEPDLLANHCHDAQLPLILAHWFQ